MNNIAQQRLEAFIEYVKDTQPTDVFDEFQKLVSKVGDPAKVKLSLLLDQAKHNSPHAAERERIERQTLESTFHHCNS